MVKAQEILDRKYPWEEREEETYVSLTWLDEPGSERGNIYGSLKVEGFTNLKKFACRQNQLTHLDLSNCVNLKELDCIYNQITDLILDNCINLKTMECSNNHLTSLNFLNGLNPENLTYLRISTNNIASDLTPFSRFVNLESMSLSNVVLDYINKGIYNRFYGSLKPLQNLTKLTHLDITDTDIDSGLEYLPDSITSLWCWSCHIKGAKVQTIYNLFANDQGIIETDYGSFTIRNFPQKLQEVKEKLKKQEKQKARELLKDELETKDEKITELEEQLQLERETNQASAEAMDNFYRQNPPREDIALKNILEELSTDYLNLNLENRQQKAEIQNFKKTFQLISKIAEQTQAEIEKQQLELNKEEQNLHQQKKLVANQRQTLQASLNQVQENERQLAKQLSIAQDWQDKLNQKEQQVGQWNREQAKQELESKINHLERELIKKQLELKKTTLEKLINSVRTKLKSNSAILSIRQERERKLDLFFNNFSLTSKEVVKGLENIKLELSKRLTEEEINQLCQANQELRKLQSGQNEQIAQIIQRQPFGISSSSKPLPNPPSKPF